MNRPQALDLFCGQGGTTQGLIDAGFDVTGVDLADHSKRYPGTFIRTPGCGFIARDKNAHIAHANGIRKPHEEEL